MMTFTTTHAKSYLIGAGNKIYLGKGKVANPQIEDGRVEIANEVADQLCKLNLSAYESRVLWVIWRKTYGWHKKNDRISYTQFEEMTGINRWHIARAINSLKQRNIISISGNKHSIEYSFQKDYDQWKSLPKGVTSHKSLPKGVTNVTEGGNETLPEGVTIITNGGNEGQSLPLGEKTLPIGVTKSLPKGVNTKAKSTIQKQYGGFSNLHKTLKESKNKVGTLTDIFKACHENAPPEDFDNLGGRIAGILKQANNDYGYLAKLIWNTSSDSIAGSHLNYIQGKIRGEQGKGTGKSRGRQLPTTEEIERSLK